MGPGGKVGVTVRVGGAHPGGPYDVTCSFDGKAAGRCRVGAHGPGAAGQGRAEVPVARTGRIAVTIALPGGQSAEVTRQVTFDPAGHAKAAEALRSVQEQADELGKLLREAGLAETPQGRAQVAMARVRLAAVRAAMDAGRFAEAVRLGDEARRALAGRLRHVVSSPRPTPETRKALRALVEQIGK